MNLTKLGIKARRNAAAGKQGLDDRCPLKRCRTILNPSIDRSGVVTWTCEPCARNARGVCRLCPATIIDRRKPGCRGGLPPMYCHKCLRKRAAERRARDYRERPEHYRMLKNRSARRPHVRARQLKYVKEWKARQPKEPRDALTKLYFRTKARENRKTRRLKALMAGKVKRITPRDFRLIVEAA